MKPMAPAQDPTDPRRFLHSPAGRAEVAAWNEVSSLHAELERLPRISEVVAAGHGQVLAACAVAAFATFHELWSEVRPEGEPATPTDRLGVLREADAVAEEHERWAAETDGVAS